MTPAYTRPWAPLLSGVLLAISFPPLALLVPPFIALVPLLVHIAERPAGAAGGWAATRAGLITGVVYFGFQLYWLAVALARYSALAIPAYALSVLVLAGLTGAFGWAVHYTRERGRLPLAVGAAVFWTALEWLQGHLGPLAFPWLGLGTALAPYPELAGAADLVGARGLTFWLAAVNGLLATAALRLRAGRPLRAARPLLAAAAVLVAVPVGYGYGRAASLEPRPAARVAVVQPNIPEDLKRDRDRAVDSSMTALSNLTLQLQGQALDLVVWPEVALPTELADSARLSERVAELSRRVGAPILAGAYGTGPGDGATRFNSAFLVTARGVGDARYDKRRLVPFVERVPFLDPALLAGPLRDGRYYGALARGSGEALLETPRGGRFGVLICYESIFASLGRRYRGRGADFLVNITNDAWFGRDSWYERTTALWQHPAHLTMRAIETRTGIARAANTGISMFVDPIGRTYERSALFEPDVRVATVFTTDAVTVFVRWGDWLATSAVVAAILAMIIAGTGFVRGRQ